MAARLAPWLLLVLAAALGFRLAAATVPRMNLDEAWSYYLCRNPVPDVMRYLENDRHPPASYLWLAGWLRVASHDEAAMRLPFVLLGTLATGLAFLLGRELLDERAALAGAALYAVAYPAWEYDTWIRSYALLSPLSLLATWLYLRTLATGRLAVGAAYGASAALLVYSHYLGFLALAAHLAHALWKRRDRLGLLAGCWALAALLYLPWIPGFLAQLQNRAGRDLQAGPAPALAARMALGMMAMETGLEHLPGLFRAIPAEPFRGVASSLLLALAGWGLWNLRRHPGLPLLLLLLAPLGLLLGGIALRFPELSRPRYYVFLIPYLGMLVGVGALHAGRLRPLAWALLALVGLTNLGVLLDYRVSPYFRSADWQVPARWVAARQQAADAVAGFDNYALHPFLYYYAGDRVFYRLDPRGFATYEYSPEYSAAGLLPVQRLWVEQVGSGELDRLMAGARRPVLILWFDGGNSPVRQWFGERYGVRDALQVDNFSPDGVAEVYLLERR